MVKKLFIGVGIAAVLLFLIYWLFFEEQHPYSVGNNFAKPLISRQHIPFWYVYNPSDESTAVSFVFQTPQNTKLSTSLAYITVSLLGAHIEGMNPEKWRQLWYEQATTLSFQVDPSYVRGTYWFLTADSNNAAYLLQLVLTQSVISSQQVVYAKQQLLEQYRLKFGLFHHIGDLTLQHFFQTGSHVVFSPRYLPQITRTKVVRYQRQLLNLNGIKIVVTGNITEHQAMQFVDTAFGHLPRLVTNFVRVHSLNLSTHIQKMRQSYYRMDIAWTTLPFLLNRKNYISAQLIQSELNRGKNTFGIIGAKVRKQLGMVYYINTKLVLLPTDRGIIRTILNVSSKEKTKVINVLQNVYSQFYSTGFSYMALREAKNIAIGEYTQQFSSPTKEANMFMQWYLLGFPADFSSRYIDFVYGVSQEGINHKIRHIFKLNFTS